MEYQEVFAAFLRLSGLTEEEGQKQRSLLEAAIRWLAVRMKEPADALPGGNDPLLNEAAAAVAYARYLLAVPPNQGGSEANQSSQQHRRQYQYKLGDLSVSESESDSESSGSSSSQQLTQTEKLERAEKLKQDALLSIADKLRDPQFIVCKA